MSKTLFELYQMAKKANVKLFHTTGFDFMNSYENSTREMDMLTVARHGSRKFDSPFGSEELALSDFQILFGVWLEEQKENIQRVYDAIALEYEPLDNYDKTSTIRTTYNGIESNIVNGTITDVSTNSSVNVKTGSEIVSDTGTQSIAKSGSETLTDNNGISNKTNTHKVSAFDSNAFVNDSEDTENIGAVTNSHVNTFTDREDVTTNDLEHATTFDDRTDTLTNNGNNTRTDNSVISKEFTNRYDETSERTHGNIGVTTSDKMLEDFTTLRWKLDFFKELFDRFLYEYTF